MSLDNLTNSIDGNKHLLSWTEGETSVPYEWKLVWAVYVNLDAGIVRSRDIGNAPYLCNLLLSWTGW